MMIQIKSTEEGVNDNEKSRLKECDGQKSHFETDNSRSQQVAQRVEIRSPFKQAEEKKKPKRGRPRKSKLSKPERKYASSRAQPATEEFKMLIKDLDFTQLETRLSRPKEVIDSYMASAENHPSIPISRCKGNPIDGKPLGGYYTVEALKALGKTEVSCYYVDVEDEIDALAKAVEFNSNHGTPLTLEEKKNNARRLHQGFSDGSGFSQDDICKWQVLL